MKMLIAGMGLSVLALPSAQAWTGTADDWRTAQANLSVPVVRVVRHYTTVEKVQVVPASGTVCRKQCALPQSAVGQQHVNRRYPGANRATGWQRSAKFVPYTVRLPDAVKRVPRTDTCQRV